MARHGTVSAMDNIVGKGLVVIGLDGEMSAASLQDGGRLIQAGLAVMVDSQMVTTAPLISWEQMLWDPRAAAVHQLDRQDVDAADRAEVVDAQLEQWLLDQGANPGRRELLTVGFNVNGFDHPFFRAALPRTMALISRRAIDLNALCFTLDAWDPNPRNQPRDWAGWKRSAKNAAQARLAAAGVQGREHDAGYDAALALESWRWLREQVHACHIPVRP